MSDIIGVMENVATMQKNKYKQISFVFVDKPNIKTIHDGEFHKDDYDIKKIDYKTAMELVIEKHYLHRRAPCSVAFGLFCKEDNSLVGVVIYGVSVSSTLLKGICGEEESKNVYELTRLWLDDKLPRNCESYLIGNSIKLLDREIIVSFADTSQGHIGYVYQATNFIYTGLSSKFKDALVRGYENQHHSGYANGMSIAMMKDTFGEENVYYKERPRKHRYIYFNCSKKRKRELLKKLKYKIEPYPKG